MKKFELKELSSEEVNLLLAGLQELPAKLANPLTQKLMEQLQVQTSTENSA